jgi:hypothetical protein
MEFYERETKDIIRRFMARQLSFPDCIAALDASLARFIPELQPPQLYELRDLMLKNNETVMNEMARRAQEQKGKSPL